MTLQSVVQRGLRSRDASAVLEGGGASQSCSRGPRHGQRSSVATADSAGRSRASWPAFVTQAFRPDEAVLWEHPFEDFCAFHGLGRISVEGGARSAAARCVRSGCRDPGRCPARCRHGVEVSTVSCAPIPVGAPELGVTLSEVDCNPSQWMRRIPISQGMRSRSVESRRRSGPHRWRKP